MILELNLLTSLTIIIYIFYAGNTYLNNKRLGFTYQVGSGIFQTKTRAIVVSELSFVHVIVSFCLWIEAYWPNTGLSFLIVSIGGIIAIPIEIRSMMKLKVNGSPVVRLLISRIEYEFKHHPEETDKIESMIRSLIQESTISRDAEIAIERLTERDDQLGYLTKSLVDNEHEFSGL